MRIWNLMLLFINMSKISPFSFYLQGLGNIQYATNFSSKKKDKFLMKCNLHSYHKEKIPVKILIVEILTYFDVSAMMKMIPSTQ